MLKAEWERSSVTLHIDQNTVEAMVHRAFPDEIVHSYLLISTGCANANIKVMFSDRPIILRIYLRDKDAGLREQKITAWVKGKIPMPDIFYVGEYQGYSFALVEYIEGIVLRDVLLQGEANTDQVMAELGSIIVAMQHYTFLQHGMLDNNLMPVSHTGSYIDFAHTCLEHPNVAAALGFDGIKDIADIMSRYTKFFPDASQRYLVHGDYDPANILVRNINNTWKVVAVLDWEFAFSGAWLFDVSNMLRYAYQLPPSYKECFIQGIEEGGVVFPDNWEITVQLLNILSLIDLLARYPKQERPVQCADIVALLEHIIKTLH